MPEKEKWERKISEPVFQRPGIYSSRPCRKRPGKPNRRRKWTRAATSRGRRAGVADLDGGQDARGDAAFAQEQGHATCIAPRSCTAIASHSRPPRRNLLSLLSPGHSRSAFAAPYPSADRRQRFASSGSHARTVLSFLLRFLAHRYVNCCQCMSVSEVTIPCWPERAACRSSHSAVSCLLFLIAFRGLFSGSR